MRPHTRSVAALQRNSKKRRHGTISVHQDDAYLEHEEGRKKRATITNMPPEIFQKILHYSGNEQHKVASRLHLTGDVLLSRQVQSSYLSCTDYTMWACSKCTNIKRKASCRCMRIEPSLLPVLKTLKISATEPSNETEITKPILVFKKKDLQMLPQSLTRLKIGFRTESRKIQQFWYLHVGLLNDMPCASNLQYLSTVCTVPEYASFEKNPPFRSFTQLQTLCIDIPSIPNKISHNANWILKLQYLPPSLTAFKCMKLSVYTEADASFIPKSLTALALNYWKDSVHMLPHLKALTHLECGLLIPTDEFIFMTSLKTLIVHNNYTENVWNSHRLPSGITDLQVKMEGRDDDGLTFAMFNGYNANLRFIRNRIQFTVKPERDRLPFSRCASTLTTLDLHMWCKYDQEYFQLSSLVALQHLNIIVRRSYTGHTKKTLRMFDPPPNLKTLCCKFTNLYTSSSDRLKLDMFGDDHVTMHHLEYLSIGVHVSFNGYDEIPKKLDVQMRAQQFPKLGKCFIGCYRPFEDKVIPILVNGTARLDNKAYFENPNVHYPGFRFDHQGNIILLQCEYSPSFESLSYQALINYPVSPWKMNRV
jgi:hypothetical protein